MGLMANRLPQIEKNDRPRCFVDGYNHNAVGGGTDLEIVRHQDLVRCKPNMVRTAALM